LSAVRLNIVEHVALRLTVRLLVTIGEIQALRVKKYCYGKQQNHNKVAVSQQVLD